MTIRDKVQNIFFPWYDKIYDESFARGVETYQGNDYKEYAGHITNTVMSALRKKMAFYAIASGAIGVGTAMLANNHLVPPEMAQSTLYQLTNLAGILYGGTNLIMLLGTIADKQIFKHMVMNKTPSLLMKRALKKQTIDDMPHSLEERAAEQEWNIYLN